MQDAVEKISKQPPAPVAEDSYGADGGRDLMNRLLRRDESPVAVGVLRATPVDLEILESSVKQLQAELHEAKSRNIYLSTLVEEHKR